MERRRRSPGEDVVRLVALMPWWAGVLLAAVSYLLLARMAGQDVTGQDVAVAVPPGQAPGVVAGPVWKTVAVIGQYLVPALCLLGAGVSAWRRRQRQDPAAEVAPAPAAADALDGLSWQDFELLVGEAFRQRGYRVVETEGARPDGGVDLVLRKDGGKLLVQCKRWKAHRVGEDVVRELVGAMAAQGAAGGFVVTSGHYTDEAVRFAGGRNVQLIDGTTLHGWILDAQRSVERPSEPTAPDVHLVAAPRRDGQPGGAMR